jgi:hypothetical protein
MDGDSGTAEVTRRIPEFSETALIHKGRHMTDSDVDRVHARLDDLLKDVGEIKTDIRGIKTRCEPCSELVQQHQATLYGNGKDGLKTEVAKLKDDKGGKGDKLSVPSVCKLIAAFAALSATIIGAMLIR